MWLKDNFGPKVFFPDLSLTSFSLTSEVGLTIICLKVEGTSLTTGAATAVPTVTSCGPGSSSSGRFTPGRFNPVPTFSQSRKEAGHSTLRVVQANATFDKDTNKPVFNKIGQVFIDICESTANVHYVTSVMQQTFGSEYVLVTADGLRIHDSAGTQGMSLHTLNSSQLCMLSYTVQKKTHDKIGLSCLPPPPSQCILCKEEV